jgi:hypothetical protein
MDYYILLIIAIAIIFSFCFKNIESFENQICICDSSNEDINVFNIKSPQDERTCNVRKNLPCKQDDRRKCWNDKSEERRKCILNARGNQEQQRRCMKNESVERNKCNEKYCPQAAALRKCGNFSASNCPVGVDNGEPCSKGCPESYPVKHNGLCYGKCAKPTLKDGGKCDNYGTIGKREKPESRAEINAAMEKCEKQTYKINGVDKGFDAILNCDAVEQPMDPNPWGTIYTDVKCHGYPGKAWVPDDERERNKCTS